MTTLMEELRLLVLQVWQSLGFERSSKTAAAVVPALIVGIVLNVVALGVMNGVRRNGRESCQKVGISHVAQSEVKIVQTVVIATLKGIDEGQRHFCRARQWMLDRHAQVMEYRSETRCAWMAHVSSKGIALRIRMELPDRSSQCHRMA
jgi:hypothetical protein